MFYTLDLTINNPSLTRLAVRDYEKSSTPVPNKVLPAEIFSWLDKVYSALTGKPLDGEGSTLTVSAKNGKFNRLYGPFLFCDDPESETYCGEPLYISWGGEKIPLKFQKNGQLTLPTVGNEAEASFATFNFHGRGEDRSLDLVVTVGDDTITMHIPYHIYLVEGQEDIPLTAMNQALKKQNWDFIRKVIKKAGSGGNDMEVWSLKELPVGKYKVTKVRQVETGHGASFILVVAPNVELGVEKEVGIWANQTLKRVLSVKPIVSEEQPAYLTVNEHRMLKSGKVSTDVSISFSALEPDPNSVGLQF